MRVLMACDAGVSPYVDDVSAALRRAGLDVDVSLEGFWLGGGSYDLVHLQWPEALFRWQATSWAAVRCLLQCVLPAWRRACPIVITRHNARPHLADNVYWQALYDRIYAHVDGVVHLGEYGVEEFREAEGRNVTHHAVIPHPVAGGGGAVPTRDAARRRLGVPSGRKVVLVFGSLRHREERLALLDGFRALPVAGKYLLAPNFGSPARPSRRHAWHWLRWEWANHEWLWPRRLALGRDCVPDELVATYFAAADVVLIPRLNTLNSGVVPQAFQYGCPVAGPDIGNIGPLLRAAGNPTFVPGQPVDCARAVMAALAGGVEAGERNRAYAREHLSHERNAALHMEFYREVLGATYGGAGGDRP